MNLTSSYTPYNWSKHTVLIAEDDPINFKYLSLLLEKRTGIGIIWAKDGIEAFEKIINHSAIDIVLLDLQLPELNGFDVLKQIKKALPSLPIIMQTANTLNNEDDMCYEAGCNGFFAKPLDVEKLFICMEQCMEEYKLYKLENQTS
jgi:CheY-like chemotaxis protein